MVNLTVIPKELGPQRSRLWVQRRKQQCFRLFFRSNLQEVGGLRGLQGLHHCVQWLRLRILVLLPLNALVPSSFLFLVVRPRALVASLLLVVRPGAPSNPVASLLSRLPPRLPPPHLPLHPTPSPSGFTPSSSRRRSSSWRRRSSS